MSTLYKRATPIQKRMLRIVEGAVLNAHHAHAMKEMPIEKFARSVAKRAVGTLSSQRPWDLVPEDGGDVLAEGGTSVIKDGVTVGECPIG